MFLSKVSYFLGNFVDFMLSVFYLLLKMNKLCDIFW